MLLVHLFTAAGVSALPETAGVRFRQDGTVWILSVSTVIGSSIANASSWWRVDAEDECVLH
jgi:hypothetical protein